jgi:serine/threonine protein kinase
LPLQIIQCEFMQKYDINEHFIQNGMMRGIWLFYPKWMFYYCFILYCCGDVEDLNYDLFGLGLVFYFCVTGEHPYEKLNNSSLCEVNIRAWSHYDLQSNKEAMDIISRLLEPSPSDRYICIIIF